MRLALGLALTLVAAGCGRLLEPAGQMTASSPAEVVLGAGQQVKVDGQILVRFLSVPADSRCPANAECFWAGDAAVALVSSTGSGPTYADTLHTPLDPKSVLRSGYRITLLEVMPYPVAPLHIPDYSVRLRIEPLLVPLGAR